jgi:hypothetical protein
VDLRQQKWWAADLRKHLETAGITREALFDDTRKRLRFHDLRGTGLTWMAIGGDDPLKIQQRAGHRTFEMTQKYIPHRRGGGTGHRSDVPAAPREPSRRTISLTESSERLATYRKYCGGAGNRTRVRKASVQLSFTCVANVSPLAEFVDSATT